MYGISVFLAVSHVLMGFKAAEPGILKYFGTAYMRAIWHGDQTGCKGNVYGVDHKC